MGASHLPVRHPGPRFPDAIGPFEVYHSVDGGRYCFLSPCFSSCVLFAGIVCVYIDVGVLWGLSVVVFAEFLLHRVVFLLLGMVLMAVAHTLSESVVFYYGGAMTIGIFLVILIILFQVSLPIFTKFYIYGNWYCLKFCMVGVAIIVIVWEVIFTSCLALTVRRIIGIGGWHIWNYQSYFLIWTT